MRVTGMGRGLGADASGCSEAMLSLSDESQSEDAADELVDWGDN
jgi:hypothetical protein